MNNTNFSNIDSRISRFYPFPSKNGEIVLSSKEVISKILENIVDRYNYLFINEIFDLSDNIVIESNSDQSIINIKFIYFGDNEIIIGIKPYLSLRCNKKVGFKSIKDKIKYEKSKRIFLQFNKLI